MTTFVLLCSFTSFCGLSGCAEGQGDHEVRARLDPERPIAEFWPSGEAGGDPWPASLQRVGFTNNEWVLFVPGTFAGQWMMTVVPRTGEALLSHQDVAFGPDLRRARGTCDIAKESI